MVTKQSSEKIIAEEIADNYAEIFLNTYIGNNIFIGSDIEQVLSEMAVVIYRDVKDPKYFGAAIHKNKQHFIVINTHQPLRIRYYSAAHELWHLQFDNGALKRNDPKDALIAHNIQFDQERAADHFAAAVMLPQKLVADAWHKLTYNHAKLQTAKQAIIRIADLSSTPYEAIVRRLDELALIPNKQLLNLDEAQWIKERDSLDISPSPLDKPIKFSKFPKFSTEIAQKLASKQLTFSQAASFLKYADPKQAEQYLKLQAVENKATLGDGND